MALRWGVVGLGTAGKARARAIAADPRSEAIAGWRGDTAAAGLPAVDSYAALLARDIDAVAICAPDTAHPALVRQALESGRHVLCEFPLAGSAEDARALFDLADARELVLHVEHIELLSPEAAWLRVHSKGRVFHGGSVRFTSGPRQEIFSLAHANLARLHRLLDALGPPEDLAVHHRDEGLLQATLSWAGSTEHYAGEAPLDLEFRQEEGARRRFEMVLEMDGGSIMQLDKTLLASGVPVSLPAGPGLFAADQLAATAAILDGAAPYVSRERILEVLALADRLAGDPLRPRLPPDRFDLSDIDLDDISFEPG